MRCEAGAPPRYFACACPSVLAPLAEEAVISSLSWDPMENQVTMNYVKIYFGLSIPVLICFFVINSEMWK